jgi:superfamily I DNA/RNA helicase
LINRYTLEGIKYNQIAVLTGNKFGRSSEILRSLLDEKDFFISAEDINVNGVVLDSIKRFKGLEKDVVILVEIEEILDFNHLMYVGLSRARLILDIISNSKVIEMLKSSLKN